MSGDLAARWRNNAIFECVVLREFAPHLPRVSVCVAGTEMESTASL